jgi:hypothetical protein
MNSFPMIAMAIFGAVAVTTLPLPAQPPTKSITARTPAQIKASYDAHQGDFDFLLGDWKFTAVRMNRGNGLQDIAQDGGKPWVKDYQQIEARRIGPPRSLGPLARAKRPEPTR